LHDCCNVAGLLLQEPSLKDIPAQQLQLQQDMMKDDISVYMLLSQATVMESCGIVTLDDYGQPVFDFQVSVLLQPAVYCCCCCWWGRLCLNTLQSRCSCQLGNPMNLLHVVSCACVVHPVPPPPLLLLLQVLQRLLHERFEEYVNKAGGRGGPGEQLARDAVVSAFKYAQQVNAHALLAGDCRPVAF
jgi:hypothetical protein